MQKVIVSNKAAKLLKSQFLWVYGSEIKNPPQNVDFVKIYDSSNRFLAIGYINIKSKIAIRVLSFKDEEINKEFIKKRLLQAYSFKKDISQAIRLIHSEGDLLPGIFIDKFNNYFSIIFTTAGSLLLKEILMEALEELFEIEGYLIRFDEKYSKIEGIEPFIEKKGNIEEIFFVEDEIKYKVNLLEGQKSGFYLDQRRNRRVASNYIKREDKALDLFSNSGGFGLYFAKKGAKVTLVDISKSAIEQAKKNFELNNLEGEFVVANCFDYLRELRDKKEEFDFINIDPPSFAKSKREKVGALRGFKDLMVNSLKVVKDGGFVAIYSCSFNISLNDLEDISLKAAIDTKSRLIKLEIMSADNDHTKLLSMKQTDYLKGLLFKVYKS